MAIFTAAATGVTSWSEFSESQRKMERYSGAVGSLQDLLTWWNSLDEVHRASKEAIGRLIHGAEAAINLEQIAWTSSGQQKSDAQQEGNAQSKSSSTTLSEPPRRGTVRV